jgi:hypothetical protein
MTAAQQFRVQNTLSYDILHASAWKDLYKLLMSIILCYHVVHECPGPILSVFLSVRDRGYPWFWRGTSENPFDDPA